MTKPRRRGLERVREFAASWWSSQRQLDPSPDERALIEEALVDYLLEESSIAASVTSAVQEALRALEAALPAASDDDASAVLWECVIDLGDRLDRQEDANLVMREHLVMLSEAARQRTINPNPL